MNFDLIIKGGTLIDGSGKPRCQADLAVTGDRIVALETGAALKEAPAHDVVDATGLIVAPGMIDAHVHGDLVLLEDPGHEAALRQGITTYILGQDGSAFSIGSRQTLEYMRQYTAGFNGEFPQVSLPGHDIDTFLRRFDRNVALNVCTLIPNGNVRMEVMGLESRAPTSAEMLAMKKIIEQGMEQGAVGISSGLDYLPSLFAQEEELAELCRVLSPYQGVYVTHMRGYNKEKAPEAFQEVVNIGRKAQCPIHISHFNSLAEQMLPHVDQARADGLSVTFDLYCYLYGSTILSMLTLPSDLLTGTSEEVMTRLRQRETRQRLIEEFQHPRFPIETIRLAAVPGEQGRRFEGMLLLEAAGSLGQRSVSGLVDFVCDLLLESHMKVGCIIRHFAERTEADIVALMKHAAMMAGSDGIYVGGSPHPRGYGCFARYLGHYVRTGVWSLEEAIFKCAGHAAQTYQLRDRGVLRPGAYADIVIFKEEQMADLATYEKGRQAAVGVHEVLVNGCWVLRHGRRTPILPGRALRRGV